MASQHFIIIVSVNSLLPVQRQAIPWTKDDFLPNEQNSSDIWMETQWLSFKKMCI